MKKACIVGLLCLNGALLAVLLAGTGVDRAYAQYAEADYVAVTGGVRGNDALYVIDLTRQRLVAWRLARVKNQVRVVRSANYRDLKRDFGGQR